MPTHNETKDGISVTIIFTVTNSWYIPMTDASIENPHLHFLDIYFVYVCFELFATEKEKEKGEQSQRKQEHRNGVFNDETDCY